jgi:hypothetical protein
VYGGEVDLVRAHDADQPVQMSLPGNAMEAFVDVLHAPVLFVASNLAILYGVRTTSVCACAVAPVRVCGVCVRGRQEGKVRTEERPKLGRVDHEDHARHRCPIVVLPKPP